MQRTPSRIPVGLALAALGVVYGDIGTSPLYALREAFTGPHGVAVTHDNVLGLLSLVIWVVTITVTLKYVAIVLRADNHGEGGILALLSLLRSKRENGRESRMVLVLLALFGAALLYGDGVITPAISVLSAVEGLSLLSASFATYVVPATVLILTALFLLQRHGTQRIGNVFGPIMLLWFGAIAALGIWNLAHYPAVLLALNPVYAVRFFLAHGAHALLALGAVVLVITGCEALYADMGHFGARPIRFAWFGAVFPALLLNYFGQGALLLRDPAAIANPFFRLAPAWALAPLVVLATVATVIASQALISGAYSLTRQAVQLGYLPQIRIVHTSEHEIGQIYIPVVNAALLAACLFLVLAFRRSDALAAAYGLTVTATMAITTALVFVVAREQWGWGLGRAATVMGSFLVIEGAFLAANAAKVVDGAWIPLLIGAAMFTIMTTWKRGRELLDQNDRMRRVPLDLDQTATLRADAAACVPGTAVFMYRHRAGTPPALRHHCEHNRSLHERVVVLTIVTEDVPRVGSTPATVEEVGNGFWRAVVRYGFMESPSIADALGRCTAAGLALSIGECSYFIGNETVVPTPKKGMATWREHLFAFMRRNARPQSDFFGIPTNRVIELGAQVEI